MAATAGRGSGAASSFSSSLDTRSADSRVMPVGRARAGRQTRGVRLAAPVPGEEAEEAQDAQIVLLDARLRVADEDDPARRARRSTPCPVGSKTAPSRVGVEGVQAEIAPGGVLGPVVGEGHDRAAAVGLDIAAQGGDLDTAAVRTPP